MRVIFPDSHSSGYTEDVEVTSCSQAGPREGKGQQPTHETFNPKVVLSIRNTGTKVDQNMRG